MNVDDFKKNLYNNEILSTNEKRFVFAKYKDEVGDFSYKFQGLYVLNNNKTLDMNKRTWKK